MCRENCHQILIPCTRLLEFGHPPLDDLNEEFLEWAKTKNPGFLREVIRKQLTAYRHQEMAGRVVKDWSKVEEFLNRNLELTTHICRQQAYALVQDGETCGIVFHHLVDRSAELRPIFKVMGFHLRVSASEALWQTGKALAYHVTRI